MARARRTVAGTRGKPRRARALDAVETIFQATAHIIGGGSVAVLNVNRVAARPATNRMPPAHTIVVCMTVRPGPSWSIML